jgi:hypothetical protein
LSEDDLDSCAINGSDAATLARAIQAESERRVGVVRTVDVGALLEIVLAGVRSRV